MSEADVIDLDGRRRGPGDGARCGAPTTTGRPCRNRAGPTGYCRVHEPDPGDEPPHDPGPAPDAPDPDVAPGDEPRAIARHGPRGVRGHPARGSRGRPGATPATPRSSREAVERFDRIAPPGRPAGARAGRARAPWRGQAATAPPTDAPTDAPPTPLAPTPVAPGADGRADAGDAQDASAWDANDASAWAAGDAGSWSEAASEALAFLRRRLTGDYAVDPLGFDRELTEQVMLPLARPLYRDWWRVRALGVDRVPPAGEAALVVANHAGTLPFDAIMTKVALHDEHPDQRHLRELAADLALRTPVLGHLARKFGDTLAHDDDAEWMLRRGDVVGVWPEGFKGVGKRYRDRYKLQRFGRGGFVQVALRTGAPIVPTAIVGSEEIYPMIGDVRVLARLLGTPYFPVTWTFPWLGPLGLIPLPSRWIIEFGEPIDTSAYGPEAADDAMLVFELTDRVRDTIQQMLYRNLMGRRSVFL